MGKFTLKYYRTRQPWPHSRVSGYWLPTPKMKSLGFSNVRCGEDGPLAWAIAKQWNERWQQMRAQLRKGESTTNPAKLQKIYPPGSLGEAFTRVRATDNWKRKAPGTQVEWERTWKSSIDPVFGDVAPASISFEDLDQWYAALLAKIGVRESHRALKIWRALWEQAVVVLKTASGAPYGDRDISLGIRRKTPTPRNAIWFEGEAVRLVKRAWRMGYRGLAAALAVAWDTSLSPVDVRKLTSAQLIGDAEGPYFSVARAKTGKAAIGTLSKRTQRLLKAYRDTLPPNLLPSSPIFFTRGSQPGPQGGRPRAPAPYTKDTLGDDFRVVRAAEFGPKEKRKFPPLGFCRRHRWQC